jgi:hypothetical protein
MEEVLVMMVDLMVDLVIPTSISMTYLILVVVVL